MFGVCVLHVYVCVWLYLCDVLVWFVGVVVFMCVLCMRCFVFGVCLMYVCLFVVVVWWIRVCICLGCHFCCFYMFECVFCVLLVCVRCVCVVCWYGVLLLFFPFLKWFSLVLSFVVFIGVRVLCCFCLC